MLSVIVYGRNDAHGYNLHKRAALSLNAIAAMLSEPSDEIIFVDYNTPDECPTFPEAIHDTLTEAAIRRLRILRVRPAFHGQYADRTRIVALEPPSRNIAVRRSNPDNRWVLSTNTDMVFLGRDPADSLSSVVARLDDGFYHLPRFELPESLWDRLPRAQPQTVMATLRDWGRRFHLNEIAYGGYDNLYDAPGDFQLFLRQDLFAIGGFDERMILGWHVDSNLARRMKLHRGEVRSALDFLFGYHCGHVRQVTALHSGNSTQNSLVTFVEAVTDPVCHDQFDHWGAPEAQIEEIRLGRGSFVGALSAALPRGGPLFTEAVNSRRDLEVRYDAEHVLPHLCNLIHELPPGQRFFFWGDDAVLLAGIRDFLAARDGAGRIILASGGDNPLRGEPIADAPGWEWLPADAALRQADVVILQYPSATVEPQERRRDYQWACLCALRRYTEIERQAAPAARRRLIAVNAENTLLQGPLTRSIACNSRLFTTRLQQGFVIDPPPELFPPLPPDAASRRCYGALHRRWAFTAEERALLQDGIAGRAAGGDRLALEIAAIAAEPELARQEFGLAPAALDMLADAAAEAVERARARVAEPPLALGPRVEAANRLVSAADWEDPDWLALATGYFDGWRGYHTQLRSRWVWERTSLLGNLLRHVDSAARPWVLVVADDPDILAVLVADRGYRTVCVDTAELLSGAPAPQDWNERLGVHGVIRPNVSNFERLQRGPQAPRLAAVLVPDPALFAAGGGRLDAVCAALAPLVEEGTYLGAGALVALDDAPADDALPLRQWQGLFEPEGLLARRGFSPAGPLDPRIPLDTVVRFAAEDAPGCVPGLSIGRAGRVLTVATVAARWPAATAGAARPPAAVAAGAAGDGIAAVGRAMLAQAPLFARILPGVEQNLLPFIQSSAPIARTLSSATLAPRDDDRAQMWLALAIDARWRRAVRVGLRGPEIDAACVLEAVFVAPDGRSITGHLRHHPGGGDIAFETAAAPLGRGVVMLLLWQRPLELEALLVTGDPDR